MPQLKDRKAFPGGPVVRTLPANAEDMGQIPGGKIPHAEGPLSLCTATLEPLLCNERSPGTAGEQPLPAATREGPSTATKAYCSQKQEIRNGRVRYKSSLNCAALQETHSKYTDTNRLKADEREKISHDDTNRNWKGYFYQN